MSTIAYKDGVIACDEQVTNGCEYQHGIYKIGRTKKYLFGFAGRLGAIWPLFDWLLEVEGNKEAPDPTYFYRFGHELGLDLDDGYAIIANKDGDLWSLNPNGFVTPQPRKYDAISSGGAYAVGAIAHGATAEQAVQAAILCDTGSGGRIHSLGWGYRDIIRPRACSKRN